MLWALGQPAAAVGLAVAFLLGLVVRALGRRACARALGVAAPIPAAVGLRVRDEVDPVGAVAVVLGGTGWGRRAAVPTAEPRRAGAVLLAGPLAVLLGAQVWLAVFRLAYPADRAALALNRPSDVLRGVVAPSMLEQVVLSVAVGLLCFGLVALVPVPPMDGFRLARLAWTSWGTTAPARDREVPLVAERLGVLALLLLLVVPVGGEPPLLTALDVVGAPLLALWT